MSADASSDARPWPDELLPFLPMIYVAWSDGALEPAEKAAILGHVESEESLSPECKRQVRSYLDPDSAPGSRDLARMLATMRQVAPDLSSAERSTLVDLGEELAGIGSGGDEALAPPVRSALERIQASLGVLPEEAAARILSPPEERETPDVIHPSCSFPHRALGDLLDGEWASLRRQVRAILAEDGFRVIHGLPVDEHRQRTFEQVIELGRRGLGSLGFPEEVGGEDDLGAFITVFETLAFGDASLVVKFGVQFGLFGGSILQLGTDRHHRELLGPVGRAELPGCFAMSETGHGSNVRELRTTATWNPEKGVFVIHSPEPTALSRKDWIGNAALHGRLATVFAQLDVGEEEHGVHAFLVPIRDDDGEALAGVTIGDDGLKEGLNGVDNGWLVFDRVEIPRENLLDRFASVSEDGEYSSPIPSPGRRFFTMIGTLVAGRISVARAGLSATKVGLATAVRYGELRRQFGPEGETEIPLLDYRSHQRRLLPRVAGATLLHLALDHLVERFLERDEASSREVESLAAGLKSYGTWAMVDALQTSRECCGGKGYLAENRIGPLRADTDVYTTFEGDNTVLAQLVTRGLLSKFRREFGDLSIFGVVRYVADRAASALTEKNPVVRRKTDPDHLRSDDFQSTALQAREDHLLTRLAQRLKNRIDSGEDSFDAFRAASDHAVTLAMAHVERVIHEQAVARIAATEDEDLRRVLTDLKDLWTLWRLEEGRAWFLENGYFEASKTKAIRQQVNRLCESVREDAVALVDAWRVPDACLGPIAFGDGTGAQLGELEEAAE